MRSQPVRLVAGAAVTNDRRGPESQLSNMGAYPPRPPAPSSRPRQPFGNRRRAACVAAT
jgi:hypothetical protein